jgi:tripartite-type tricarboxylate transporter receptor subunit TctC
VVARLSGACNEILATAEFRKKMLDLGITTSAMSPAGFTGFVREQVVLLAPTVKGAGVKL